MPHPFYAKSTYRSLAISVLLSGLIWGGLLGCSSVLSPETDTLFVSSQLVDCVGVSPQTCLQVRTDSNAAWELFYGDIEGFNFESGFFYRLEVEIHQVPNPPADGSSLRYVLLRVVSKIPE